MKGMSFQIKLLKLFAGYFLPLFVRMLVQDRLYLESALRLGAGDEVDDGFVADQRPLQPSRGSAGAAVNRGPRHTSQLRHSTDAAPSQLQCPLSYQQPRLALILSAEHPQPALLCIRQRPICCHTRIVSHELQIDLSRPIST